jgi:hypothetical protein
MPYLRYGGGTPPVTGNLRHVNLSRRTDLITTGIGCHSTKPTEISMLKCYDSVTDGSVSRWSFHRACIDPTAPDDAPCRRNLVVRSYVFF